MMEIVIISWHEHESIPYPDEWAVASSVWSTGALGQTVLGVVSGAGLTILIYLSWVILILSFLTYQTGVTAGNSHDFYKGAMREYKTSALHKLLNK